MEPTAANAAYVVIILLVMLASPAVFVFFYRRFRSGLQRTPAMALTVVTVWTYVVVSSLTAYGLVSVAAAAFGLEPPEVGSAP